MVARCWSDAQKQVSYSLADNQIALHGTWNLDLLRVELSDLRDQAVDLAMLGFNDDDVARFIGPKAGLTDPDEVPDVPPVPVTQAGDVWLLGAKVTCPHCHTTQDVKRKLTS